MMELKVEVRRLKKQSCERHLRARDGRAGSLFVASQAARPKAYLRPYRLGRSPNYGRLVHRKPPQAGITIMGSLFCAILQE